MKHILFNITTWFAIDPKRLVVVLLVLMLVLALVAGVEAGPCPGGSSCP